MCSIICVSLEQTDQFFLMLHYFMYIIPERCVPTKWLTFTPQKEELIYFSCQQSPDCTYCIFKYRWLVTSALLLINTVVSIYLFYGIPFCMISSMDYYLSPSLNLAFTCLKGVQQTEKPVGLLYKLCSAQCCHFTFRHTQRSQLCNIKKLLYCT